MFRFLISISLASLFPLPETKMDASPKTQWDFLLNLSRQNCPDAYVILSGVKNWKTYVQYAGNSDKQEILLKNFNTLVHESCHGFQFEFAHDADKRNGYYVEPGVLISVEQTKVFNSRELNKIIPDSIRKKISRYETYIGDGSFISSQVSGIYGLLDEFSAYYHGALCNHDLKPWLENKYGYKDVNPWIDFYLDEYSGSVNAYYEFRLFMTWYLRHAKLKYPAMYKDLLDNLEFRKAFTLLYDRFTNLAVEFHHDIQSLAQTLNDHGINASVETRVLKIKKGNSWIGYGHHMDEMVWLEQQFTPELRQILTEFRY